MFISLLQILYNNYIIICSPPFPFLQRPQKAPLLKGAPFIHALSVFYGRSISSSPCSFIQAIAVSYAG